MGFTLDFLITLSHALWLSSPLLIFFITLISVIGQIVGRIEDWSAFDSLYWSFITAFTVGYGDIRPTSRSAKLLSILIALLGIMFTGGIVAITVKVATEVFERHMENINPTLTNTLFYGFEYGDASLFKLILQV